MSSLERLRYPVLAIVLVLGGLPAAGLVGPGGDEARAAPGLEAAEIVRDEHGVPHVYADSREALFHANGYVQAQDRLWAMDLLRHIAYGNASSVVGPGGGILEMDLLTRRNLYNEPQLREQLREAPPAFQEGVRAFVDGINQAAAELHATGEVPAEFGLLDHAFHPWKPVDVVAVAAFQLAFFGNGGGEELDNARLFDRLADQLGTSRASSAFGDLVWGERDDAYPTIQSEPYTRNDPHADAKRFEALHEEQKQALGAAVEAESFGLETDELAPTDVGFYAGRDVGPEDFRLGSNALLVGPQLTENGTALLGGGPQTGYFTPQLFYEIGLHSEEAGIQAEGINALGTPSVIIGRTDAFAWTVTSGISDQTDVVALPAEGERTFAWDEETRRLECRTERHELFTPPALWAPTAAETAGSDPARAANITVENATNTRRVLEQEVCRADLSITGGLEQEYPIVAVERNDAGDPETFFAQRTSARGAEVPSSAQWLQVQEQDSVDAALQLFDGFSFTFNFHFAGEDSDGESTICYVHVGRQPVRDDRLDPRFPTPAGDEWAWEATITGRELPRECDPAKGYFANWNNLPQHGWSSGDARELWGSIHRVERLDRELREALDANPGGLDLGDVQAVLEDAATEDSLAGQIVPLLTGPYADAVPDPAQAELSAWAQGGPDSDFPWRSGEPGTPPADAETSYAPNDTFTNRSGLVYADRGHTVYDRILPALLDEVFADELGPHVREVAFDPRNSSDPHAGDHGQHNNPFAILVDALAGETERNWCDDVDTSPATESCREQVADAFASIALDRDGDGRIDLTGQHQSPFTSLGVGPAYEIPMTNRATYYHFHVGSDTSQSFAVLPPGSGGHVNAAQFARLILTGEEPEHMDDQLEPYVEFEPKSVPFERAEAVDRSESVRPLVPLPG